MTCLRLTTSGLNNDLKNRHIGDLQTNLWNLSSHDTWKNFTIWTFATKYNYIQIFVTSQQPYQTKW